jgi:hypothetical protein
LSRYRGTPNDRIMLHTLNALNFMAMGQMSDARVELNRAQVWQDDAHHRYAKAIELAHKKNQTNVEAASKKWTSKSGGAGWAAQSGGVMHSNTRKIMDRHYGSLADKQGHAKYGNPFASHLRGVFRLAIKAYDGDLAMARFELRDVAAMVPRRIPLLADDIEYASTAGHLEPTTWIYFMTGRAPELKQEKVVMPLALSGSFTMPTLALPKMVFDETNPMHLHIRTKEQGTVQTHLLADNAAIAAAQFKERLPIIITQEGVRATGKAIASYVAMRFAQQQQSWAASLLAFGTVIYQVSSAQADLRTWRTLPAEIQLARIPTPSSGEIQLGTLAGRDLGTAHVTPGECNILVVSMPSAASAMPSLMPIQLTGSIPTWTPIFDLQADPDAQTIETQPPVLLVGSQTAEPLAPPATATPVVASIDAPPAVDQPEVAAEKPSVAEVAIDEPEVAVDEPEVAVDEPDVAVDEPEVAVAVQPSQPTHDPPATKADNASPEPVLVTAPPPVEPAAPTPQPISTLKQAPIAMHLSARTMHVQWGQPMEWSPPLDDVLDTRIRLSFDQHGYTRPNANTTTIMTTPRSLFLRRTARLHRGAIFAIGKAMQNSLLERGLIGGRVHVGTTNPDKKGEVELFYLVTLPLDGAPANPRWPKNVRPIPEPNSTPSTLVETSKEHAP